MRLPQAADVTRACPMAGAMAGVERGLEALPTGQATVPVRASLPPASDGVALGPGEGIVRP